MVVVRVGDEQLVDEIVLLHRRRLLAAAAAPLRAVLGERLRLHVAGVRERDHHVLRRDQVLDREVLGDRVTISLRRSSPNCSLQRGRARRAMICVMRAGLGEDVEQVGDRAPSPRWYSSTILSCSRPVRRCRRISRIACACVVGQAVAVVPCRPNSRGEALGRAKCAAGALPASRATSAGAPGARHQRRLRLGRRRRRLDQRDDLVDVRQRHRQAFEHVAALARLAQLEHGAPRDHLAAVRREGLEHLLQVEQRAAGRRPAPPCSCRRCPAAASACTGCSARPRAPRRA